MPQSLHMATRKAHFSAWKGLRWSVVAFAIAVFGLMLRRLAAVAEPLPPDLARASNEQFQTKWMDLQQAHQRGQPTETRFTAEEISAALEYPGEAGQVTFSGDRFIGQFIANVSGKNIYVTVEGRLGAADGYVTFEPAELKIGDLPLPNSVVNAPLQTKLSQPETRARLKLPDYISNLRIENSQLVVVEK